MCLIILVSENAAASDGADEFLLAYKNINGVGGQVLVDYRLTISSRCERGVSVSELRKFTSGQEFQQLELLKSMGATSMPSYGNILSEIPCEQYR
jgi:hypothetical protein